MGDSFARDLSISYNQSFYRTAIRALEDAGAVNFSRSSEVPTINDREFQSILELAFFGYYYDGNRTDDFRDYIYLTLGDGLIASLYTDESKLQSPSRGSRIGDHPLRDMEYAYGHCEICPKKGFLGRNLGQSELYKQHENAQSIEVPDTYEFSMYDYSTESDRLSEDQEGNCHDCVSYLCSWMNEKLRENVNYLWGLGGTGMLHEFNISEEYNILDVLVGREPPGEFDYSGVEISQLAKEQSGKDINDEEDIESAYNIILGMYLASKLGFDDFWANCKISEPYSMSYELDVVLMNYSKQLFVCIETTMEDGMSPGRYRKKARAADQLQTLLEDYGWTSQYIYVSTGNISDIDNDRIERLTYETNDRFEIVRPPNSLDLRPIEPTNAVSTPPKEFGKVMREFCYSWINQIRWRLGPMVNGYYHREVKPKGIQSG